MKIVASAPTRICDLGGWTDTWFAVYGNVLNFAIDPGIQVSVEISKVDLFLEKNCSNNFIQIRDPAFIIATKEFLKIKSNLKVEISSEMPIGSSVGTSAAVSVCLAAAMSRIKNMLNISRKEICKLAHFIETEKLNLESGIQDQVASCYGGANLIKIINYPEFKNSSVYFPKTLNKLEKRMSLIYLNCPHQSSVIHKKVIEELKNTGCLDERLMKLRTLPEKSLSSLRRENFNEFGQCMIENTELQRELLPDLVSPLHQKVIDISKKYEAIGWKVNGAGGNGGSLSILFSEEPSDKFLEEIRRNNFTNVTFAFNTLGLRIEEK